LLKYPLIQTLKEDPKMTCIHPHLPTQFLQSIPDNNDDLSVEITRLAGHINAANYRFLKLLAALIERGAWNGYGIKSPAHWLNYHCGISLGPAREKVRVARCLQSLPLIDEAFGKGEISYSKVRAMTRAATPENEDYLLNIARHGTASHVEKLVRQYEQVERLGKDSHGKAQQDARAFSYHYDDDGMLVFKGRLAPEDGAVFLKAMDALMHQLNEDAFQRERAEEENKGVEARTPAPEMSEKVSAGTPIPDESRDTFPQKRADAVVRMAEHYLATGKAGPIALSGGDKYQVIVHINADAHQETQEPHAWLDTGPVLAPATVRRLVSEASMVTVLEDGEGNVLNVGRKTRTVPPAMRRALLLRDRGCRFPGCCESKYVDAHHIRHWCDGGETCLDNLVLLCRWHHRLLHDGGYGIEKDAADNPVFITPAGRSMDTALYPQFPTATEKISAGTCLAIEQEHEALGLDIDDRTAVTAWRGEVMDYNLAVAALQDRRLPGA
jgi:hypothetical protein